jgi:hypothetical protein
MGRKAKHRYSQKEEDLIWEFYTAEEKEEHNKYVLGYGWLVANTRLIDSIRNDAIARKEQNDSV